MLGSEPDSVSLFKTWLEDHGGQFHPDVHFIPVPSGISIVAGASLPSDTQVVMCPFALAITREIALQALSNLQGLIGLESLSERELICTYICLHWVRDRSNEIPLLVAHSPYINTLPPTEKLRTPLHFTFDELNAFKGTNLYGATIDREREWRIEWNRCKSVLTTGNSSWAEDFTWQKYLTASSYLSSRAFPSTLLSPNPTLVSSSMSYPILLPGIDSLNHARGQPVSWAVSYPIEGATSATAPTVSLVLHNPAVPGQELFNNYGAKPNSELILGYGFSLPDNPDDTIVLKIGGTDGKKWEVGRSASGADGVWNEVLRFIAQDTPESELNYEDQLEASGVLTDMVQTLIDHLPTRCDPSARPEVASMWEHYLEGQRDILESLIAFARDKEELAIEKARTLGIELVFDDDE